MLQMRAASDDCSVVVGLLELVEQRFDAAVVLLQQRDGVARRNRCDSGWCRSCHG